MSTPWRVNSSISRTWYAYLRLSRSGEYLLEPKLAQAYEILVPCRERPVGARVKEFEYENGGDLREGFVRPTAPGSQTASLIEFAQSHDLEISKEWVFEDEGYSGATLQRPWLERVRDLAAEGQIQVVLAYSPDRLSRKYAYQILLIEEFARQGSRDRVREVATRQQRGRSTPGSVPRHDR